MDPIKHVIALMLENHSFDQMLGAFKSVYPALEGVDPAHPFTNTGLDGRIYAQSVTTDLSGIDPDPPHELDDVRNQIAGNNSGFVRMYESRHSQTSSSQRQRIMDYYQIDSLPALHTLARNFRICDHWFSSVPGPTWTNRFFFHSGTSLGWTSMPSGIFNLNLHWYDQDTIYDRLNERGDLKWRIYFGDIPQSLLLVHQWQPSNAARYRPLSYFFQTCAGPESDFPNLAVIEPRYFWPKQNDDHPPHKPMNAQKLIADVYNAIRANQPLWESSLLVILYDEHGGLCDHVTPPPAIPPDAHNNEYDFSQYGLRVPAVLVSPWVDRDFDSTVFDHTSFLRYLIDKWGLNRLTARSDSAANPFTKYPLRPSLRTDTPLRIDIPDPFAPARLVSSDVEVPHEFNDHQQALLAFSERLETMTDDSAVAKRFRTERMLESTPDAVAVGIERVNRFITQQQMKAGPGF